MTATPSTLPVLPLRRPNLPVLAPFQPKIFKIRLNPEDAKYGVNTKAKREASGMAFTRQSLDDWKRAAENTAATILKSLPQKMREEIADLRLDLPSEIAIEDGAEIPCYCDKCNGHGYREDYAHWIVVDGKNVQGKWCFKCQGSGIEPSMEPIFFRRRAIDRLRTQDRNTQLAWANKVLNEDEDELYICVLEDIAEAILESKDITRLSH